MSYLRKRYRNGQSRQPKDFAGGAVDSTNARPKRYVKREGAPPPADNYLRRNKTV